MGTHLCPAGTCTLAVPRGQLACEFHWFKVSKATRAEVSSAFRSGSNSRHVAAMQDAIEEMNA